MADARITAAQRKAQSKTQETAKATETSRSTAATTTVTTATTSEAATGVADPKATQPPTAYERFGVALNANNVVNAFKNGTTSRSVKYVQFALRRHGFDDQLEVSGQPNQATADAYKEFQKTVDEKPNGLPSAYSLDALGFDVIG